MWVRLHRFLCDWDPPAGHEWAGYPIRSENAAAFSEAVKVTDPKKQRRCFYPPEIHALLVLIHLQTDNPTTTVCPLQSVSSAKWCCCQCSRASAVVPAVKS